MSDPNSPPATTELSPQTVQEQIDRLTQQAWDLVNDDTIRAREISEEAFRLSQSGLFEAEPYRKGVAVSLCIQGRISSHGGEADASLRLSLEALAILEEIGDKEWMPRVLHNIGSAYSALGDLSEGLKYAFQEMEVSQEIGDRKGQAIALLSLGNVYYNMGENARCLSYMEDGIALFEELGESYWVALSHNNLCYIHFLLQDYDEALMHGIQGLAVAHEVQNPRLEAMLGNSLGDVYLSLGDPENALISLQESVRISRKLGSQDSEVDSLKLIGQAYKQQGDLARAETYLLRALTLAEKLGHKRFIYELHELLSGLFRQRGEFEKALIHLEQFHQIKESVFNEESNLKLRNLEILSQTESAQKEAEYYASLYQIEQQRRQLAEVLNRVGQALTSTLDLQEVLDSILEQLAGLVAFDRGSLLLMRGNELEFVAARGYSTERDPLEQRIPIDLDDEDGVFVRIYKTKRPLALSNLNEYPGWQKVFDVPVPEAWLGVPLIRNNDVVGMLSLARSEATLYDEADITVAITFAVQAAIALENAQLYGQITYFNEQLEEEVRRRTEDVREAYDQLERLDRTKSEFISITAHELRTPLTVMKGYAQLLQLDSTLRENPQHANLIRGIVTGSDRLYEIVNTMLTMVKIDSRELEIFPEPFDLNEALVTLAIDLAADVAERKQTLLIDPSVEQLPSIAADHDVLKTVFSNILVNAIKYTPDGGKISINGRSWTTPPHPDLSADAVEIVVADTGIGIAKDTLDLIFTKFYQTGNAALHSSGKTKFKGGGPGLGLAISRGIIEAHNGQLWAESEGYDETSCPGSQFHIVLPIRQAPVELNLPGFSES